MKHIIEQHPKVFLCLLFTAVTGLAYLPMGDFGFINYDDNIYVYENPHVQQGLTGAGLEWAFTTTLTGNWHPLIWLSLMPGNTLFGAGAGDYHLVNFSYFQETLAKPRKFVLQRQQQINTGGVPIFIF